MMDNRPKILLQVVLDLLGAISLTNFLTGDNGLLPLMIIHWELPKT